MAQSSCDDRPNRPVPQSFLVRGSRKSRRQSPTTLTVIVRLRMASPGNVAADTQERYRVAREGRAKSEALGKPARPDGLERPAVQDHILQCYPGVGSSSPQPGAGRRVAVELTRS